MTRLATVLALAAALCGVRGAVVIGNLEFEARQLKWATAEAVLGPARYLVLPTEDLGCGSEFSLFVESIVASLQPSITSSGVDIGVSVIVLLEGAAHFTDACSLEQRTRAAQEGGAHGVLFVTPEVGKFPMSFAWPYDGSLAESEAARSIPAGSVDRAIFVELTAVAAATAQQQGSNNNNDDDDDGNAAPIVQLVDHFQLDADKSEDPSILGPAPYIVYGLCLALCCVPLATALRNLRERAQERSQGGTRSKGSKFGVRDLVYIGQVVQFTLNCFYFGSNISWAADFSYPNTVATSGTASWFLAIGMFFAQPVNNLNFMLVVAAWADALEVVPSSSKKSFFKSQKIRTFFIAFNSASFLIEFVHIPAYMLRSPLDIVTGQLANLFTSSTLLFQTAGFLIYGRKLVKTLAMSARANSSKGKASKSDERILLTVRRMSRFITMLAVLLLFTFFTSAIFVVALNLGLLDPIGFQLLFAYPQAVARTGALFLYVAIVTPVKKKAQNKVSAAAASSVASAAVSTDVTSRRESETELTDASVTATGMTTSNASTINNTSMVGVSSANEDTS